MNKFTFTLLLFVAAIPAGRCQIHITHSPYLQAMHDTGVTIVWTTDKDAIGWVELAPDDGSHFYKQERPKYFASSHGFKDVSTVHKVTLQGLTPGTSYRYRVYAQEVTCHVGTKVTYGNVAATNVYRQEPLTFTTSKPEQLELSFAVINDIHGRNAVMKNLLGQLDWPTTDLVFFNGDMADNLLNETQLFAHYMDTPTVHNRPSGWKRRCSSPNTRMHFTTWLSATCRLSVAGMARKKLQRNLFLCLTPRAPR